MLRRRPRQPADPGKPGQLDRFGGLERRSLGVANSPLPVTLNASPSARSCLSAFTVGKAAANGHQPASNADVRAWAKANDIPVNAAGVVGNAEPGWDPVTGWGSPDAQYLVPLLAHTSR